MRSAYTTPETQTKFPTLPGHDELRGELNYSYCRPVPLGLFSFSVFCGLTVLILVPDAEVPAAGFGILSFLLLIALQYQARQNRPGIFWTSSSFIVVALYLTAGGIVVFLAPPEKAWLFWPMSIITAIGIVPWPVFCLIPLLILFSGIGLLAVSFLGIGEHELLLLIATVIASVLLSRAIYRKLTEHFIMENAVEQFAKTISKEEVLQRAAVFLRLMFKTSNLVYLRNGRAYLVAGAGRGLQSISLPNVWGATSARAIYSTVDVTLEHTRETQRFYSAIRLGFVVNANKQGLIVGFRYPLAPLFFIQHDFLLRSLEAFIESRLSAIDDQQARMRENITSLARAEETAFQLSAVVHEINNSVQDIIFVCDELSAKLTASDPAHKLLEQLIPLARSIAEGVSDVRRRKELEELPDLTPHEVVCFQTVLAEVVRSARLAASRKGVEFVLMEDFPSDVRVRVFAQEHLITIFRELVRYAISVSSSETMVRLEVTSTTGFLCLKLRGSGLGISVVELELLEDTERSLLAGGHLRALGLLYRDTKRVVESMGGAVRVSSSDAGGGVVIELELPVISSNAGSREVTSDVVEGSSSKPELGWILVVDDHPNVAVMLQRIISALGSTAVSAISISEALNELDHRAVPPQVVITDLALPDGDGLDLIQKISDRFERKIPILVVSGEVTDDRKSKAASAGAVQIMTKPVSQRVLYQTLSHLLKSKEEANVKRTH